MFCESCHAIVATHQVTQRSASGGFNEIHYCERCCKASAGLPDPAPAGLYTLVDRETGRSRVGTLDDLFKMIPPSTNL